MSKYQANKCLKHSNSQLAKEWLFDDDTLLTG